MKRVLIHEVHHVESLKATLPSWWRLLGQYGETIGRKKVNCSAFLYILCLDNLLKRHQNCSSLKDNAKKTLCSALRSKDGNITFFIECIVANGNGSLTFLSDTFVYIMKLFLKKYHVSIKEIIGDNWVSAV